jgi:hypothetical protein
MTREEALKFLARTPYSDETCIINTDLTQAEAVDVITQAVRALAPGSDLDDFMLKRVHQVTQNKRYPTFKRIIVEATA